jgi:hypothetical protein
MDHGSGVFYKEGKEEEMVEWVLEGVKGGEKREGGERVKGGGARMKRDEVG